MMISYGNQEEEKICRDLLTCLTPCSPLEGAGGEAQQQGVAREASRHSCLLIGHHTSPDQGEQLSWQRRGGEATMALSLWWTSDEREKGACFKFGRVVDRSNAFLWLSSKFPEPSTRQSSPLSLLHPRHPFVNP